MSQRTTEIKRSNKPNAVVRNKEYYFNTLDLEHDLLIKASSIAERMMVAFMRENKVEVSINVDEIANKIIDKIGSKLQSYVDLGSTRQQSDDTKNKKDDFSLDDGPVIIKTEKIEVKGKVGSIIRTGDSISDSMDMLEGLNI
jgi:hypothetical protein